MGCQYYAGIARETMLSAVTITFLLATTVTFSEELTSEKYLHRKRRFLVFPTTTVLQVGSRVLFAGFYFSQIYIFRMLLV
jgi:putative flippase GtrA